MHFLDKNIEVKRYLGLPRTRNITSGKAIVPEETVTLKLLKVTVPYKNMPADIAARFITKKLMSTTYDDVINNMEFDKYNYAYVFKVMSLEEEKLRDNIKELQEDIKELQIELNKAKVYTKELQAKLAGVKSCSYIQKIFNYITKNLIRSN